MTAGYRLGVGERRAGLILISWAGSQISTHRHHSSWHDVVASMA